MNADTRLASLLDIDDDAKIMIVDLLSMRDLEAFTSTCRTIRTIAQPQLEKHMRLKSMHMITKFSSSGDRPLDVLYKIKDCPIIAQYVERLVFDNGWYDLPLHEDEVSGTEKAVYDEACSFAAKDILSALPGDRGYRGRRTHPNQLHARDQSAFALMISLPSLGYLKFGPSTSPIGTELLLTVLGHREISSTQWPPLFQELRTVDTASAISYSPQVGINYCRRFDLETNIFGWILAPNIETLRALHPFDVSPLPSYRGYTSSLQTLHLAHGGCQHNFYYPELLSPLKNLRELKYSAALPVDTGVNLAVRPLWDVAFLINTLGEVCADTLEVLHLVQTPCDTTLITTELLNLPKLREFEGDIIMLLPYYFDSPDYILEDQTIFFCSNKPVRGANHFDVSRTPSIIDIFPPSIERIILDIGRLNEPADMLLRDINPLSGFRTKLPVLKRFSYHGLPLCKETYASLKASGVAVGRKSGFEYVPKFVKDIKRRHGL